MLRCLLFFFNDTATTEIYTLSLHDALPIWGHSDGEPIAAARQEPRSPTPSSVPGRGAVAAGPRSEEHTSELQSRLHLVCRLLLEKKKNNTKPTRNVRVSCRGTDDHRQRRVH